MKSLIAVLLLVACGPPPSPAAAPAVEEEATPTVVEEVPDASPAVDPEVATDPRACEADEDCVLYCPSAPGCCSSDPCGCRGAVHVGREADADTAYAARCEPSPGCSPVGCAYEPARGAACRDHRCVATDGF